MDEIKQVADLTFSDRIFENYPISFITMVLALFGFTMRFVVYIFQSRTLIAVINKLFLQIEHILQKKEL